MQRRAILLVAALACCLVFVAGPARAADSKVSGTVTLKGKPVAAGRIFFHLDNGQFVGCRIKKDGTYTIDRVPVGTWKVTFQGKDIPAKYKRDATTPLTVAIKEGKTQLDFNLQ